MATAAPRPPPSRRPPSTLPAAHGASITKGATARSAVSARTASALSSSAQNRRQSLSRSANNGSHDSLAASLKEEIEQKEQLLVQIQNKDVAINSLKEEHKKLTSALHAAETQINELYADQSRSELELAQRIDISDKLRSQVRELEKEKRDIQRRYDEQVLTFEAERQAFYDNEQHLKSRIQSLTQVKRQPEPASPVADSVSESDMEKTAEEELSDPPAVTISEIHQDLNDPETEPAEMTSLKLELSTLATSHASLQNTLVLLQTQLQDLRRVNHELQEENESYMMLLRERTLTGQFDVRKQMGDNNSDNEEFDDDGVENTDTGSLRSAGRSTLDRVDELVEEGSDLDYRRTSARDTDSPASRHSGRPSRRRTTSNSSVPRGETLADLPITGPGLDLAAELGRAENKDILAGADTDRHPLRHDHKPKRSKKRSDGRKVSGDMGTMDSNLSLHDIDALRNEVKSLKDANKALSLYASKIIDRIISQEGFEHVLAVDYDREPKTPSTAKGQTSPNQLPAISNPKSRPQSLMIQRSSSNPISSFSGSQVDSSPSLSAPKLTAPSNKAQRRSLSFDWRGFSLFSSQEKKNDNNLRPLTLKPGSSSLTGARKLDNHEDEDDRRERERLNATMKLMGIEPSPPQPPSAFTFPAPTQKPTPSPTPPTPNTYRRFSFFGYRNTDQADLSTKSASPEPTQAQTRAGLGFGTTLTQEALRHAEAENTLAALDAHERTLSAEIGRGSGGGFTELSPRTFGSRRSRRSGGGSGSGSTVWSAGMSGHGEDE